MLSQNKFEHLPKELKLKIFFELSLHDIYIIPTVNKEWANIIREGETLWKKKAEENFPHLVFSKAWRTEYNTATHNEYYRKPTKSIKKQNNFTKFFTLVKEGNLAKLKKQGDAFKLEMLAEVDKTGTTLLDWANKKNHQELLDFFFQLAKQEYLNFNKTNIDVKKIDKVGRTILHWIASTNQENIVYSLVLQGCQVNAEQHTPPVNTIIFKPLYTRGITALHIAAAYGRIEIINTLLKLGASINGNIDNQVYAPIHLAALNRQYQIIDVLLEQGAEINIFSSLGATPLHIAAKNGDIQLISTLLEKHANIEASDNSLGYQSLTPLSMAAKYGQLEAIKLLLINGANINGSGNANSPFRLAIKRDHDETLKFLIENEADCKLGFMENESPLLLAAQCGAVKIVNLLLATNESDKHTLFAAAAHGHDEIVKLLIKKGNNINATFSLENDTALHLLSQRGMTEAIKTLIENGANINAIRSDGASSLFVAAANNQLDAVKILLDYDAEANLSCHDGETALSIAKKNNHVEIVNILKTKSIEPFQIKSKRKNITSKFKYMMFGQRAKHDSLDDNIALNMIQPKQKDDEDDDNSPKLSH